MSIRNFRFIVPVRQTNGFTLIEVLVALVLTASLLGVILAGTGTAAERRAAADLRREAVIAVAARYEIEAASPLFLGERRVEAGRLQLAVSEVDVARDPRGFSALVELRLTALDARHRTIYTLVGRTVKEVPL